MLTCSLLSCFLLSHTVQNPLPGEWLCPQLGWSLLDHLIIITAPSAIPMGHPGLDNPLSRLSSLVILGCIKVTDAVYQEEPRPPPIPIQH